VYCRGVVVTTDTSSNTIPRRSYVNSYNANYITVATIEYDIVCRIAFSWGFDIIIDMAIWGGKMTSKIVKCKCTHFMQDEINGAGNRTANGTQNGQFRCTVCGTLHGSTSIVASTAKVAEQPQHKKAIEKKKKGEKKEINKKSLKGGKR